MRMSPRPWIEVDGPGLSRCLSIMCPLWGLSRVLPGVVSFCSADVHRGRPSIPSVWGWMVPR